MARRRSNNRRSSIRSMNVTELDDDSEIMDKGNPMWWKNIEDDMTIRQSRRSSLAETTGNILDLDSRVDPTELTDEWWKKLDKTDHESRRTSSRRSLKSIETPNESFNSDDTDDVSIKKRKVLLRDRPNKNTTMDNFARALVDSDVATHSEPVPGEKRKSNNDVKSDGENPRKKLRKIRDQGDPNIPMINDEDTSVNTSNDTEIIVKTRPKPFKKRFTKLSDNVFDDILKNQTSGPSGINSPRQKSQIDDSPVTKSPTMSRTSPSNKTLAVTDESAKTPIKFNDAGDSQLMGPPKTSSHQKRLSSISRKLNLTSEESESDGGLRKTRARVAKKITNNFSVNPFDEILSGHLEESGEADDAEKKNSSSGTGTGNEDRIDESIEGGKNTSRLGKFRGSRDEINRRSISVIRENPQNSSKHSDVRGRSNSMRMSVVGENSLSQIIEEIRENEVKNNSDTLTLPYGRASVERKILEVSLTRISPLLLERHRIDEEKVENQNEIENVKTRSLRSTSQRRFVDSAYELPDQERSLTPIISATESENDKSSTKNLTKTTPRMSLRSNREDEKSMRESIKRSMKNKTRASTSRKMNNRGNLSQTKFFSDEDMSMEDLDYVRETNFTLRQNRAGEEEGDTSRKNVADVNKSGKRRQDDENISEEKNAEKIEEKSSNSRIERETRSSTKNVAAKNKSQKSFLDEDSSEDDADNAEKIEPTLRNSRLDEKSRMSRKSVTFTNKSRRIIESDESISEDEETTKSKSSNFLLDKTGTSSEIIAIKNKHRQRIESDETISKKKGENLEGTKDKLSNSQFKNTTRTARKSLAFVNKSQSNIESGESFSEDEPEGAEKSITKTADSRHGDKTRKSTKSLDPTNKSRRSVESDETISMEKVENLERTKDKLSNSQLKNTTRTARKSLAFVNKSQSRIESGRSINEDETEDAEKSNTKTADFRLGDKTRKSTKSLDPTNKSRRSVESDETISTEKVENLERTKDKLSNSQLKNMTRTTRKSLAFVNKSQSRIESGENISEDEPEGAEKSNPKTANSRLGDETQKSTKSLDPTNKSRGSIESGESISEDEAEDAKKSNSKSSDSRLGDKTRKSTKSLDPTNKSRRSVESDETISTEKVENLERTKDKLSNSQLKNTTRTARKSLAFVNKSQSRIESGENISEDEPEGAEKSNTKTANSRLGDKTRKSTKSLDPTNKSRGSIESGESISEDEAEDAEKSNLKSSDSRLGDKSRKSKKNLDPTNKSRGSIESDESISEDEAEGAETSNLKSSDSQLGDKTRTSRKNVASANESRQIIESDESISEDEDTTKSKSSNLQLEKTGTSSEIITIQNKHQRRIESDEMIRKDGVENLEKSSNSRLGKKTRTSTKSLKATNKSRRIQSENNMNDDEARDGKKSFSISSRKGEKNESRANISQKDLEFNNEFEDAEDEENENLPSERNTRKIIELSKNSLMIGSSTNHRKSSLSVRKNDTNDLSTEIPMEKIPVVSINHHSKNVSNKRVTSPMNKSNVPQSQKSITDFFTPKLLEKSDSTTIRENAKSFEEKLSLIKMKMDRMKKRVMQKNEEIVKRKETNISKRLENIGKTKNSIAPAKTTKVIDKAYIVNGVVYKRPKLPRPKPWVTDRLYRHLWKCMEEKFKLATRVKSEKFVEQLTSVVALTIRRKKYENYKLEVDILMKEMARLGIIKTRNDFYDFCYDFLPYDFRVKVTPILLPGNISTIPYDPAKLHTPILRTP